MLYAKAIHSSSSYLVQYVISMLGLGGFGVDVVVASKGLGNLSVSALFAVGSEGIRVLKQVNSIGDFLDVVLEVLESLVEERHNLAAVYCELCSFGCDHSLLEIVHRFDLALSVLYSCK